MYICMYVYIYIYTYIYTWTRVLTRLVPVTTRVATVSNDFVWRLSSAHHPAECRYQSTDLSTRSIDHGRYRRLIKIYLPENTVNIDGRWGFTYGELRSIVDDGLKSEMILCNEFCGWFHQRHLWKLGDREHCQSWSREGQRCRLKRRWDTRYVGYNRTSSDALTTDEFLPQAHCFNSRLRYLRMLYHAGVHPPFGNKGKTKKWGNAQSARTLH